MIHRLWRTGSMLMAMALLLAACAGQETSLPTPVAQQATAVVAPTTKLDPSPQPTRAKPTMAPKATEAPAATAAPPATEAPAPTAVAELPEATVQPPQNVEGHTVLELDVGDGPNQIGISGSGPEIVGPRSFRIGSDGSIRLLDNLNRRILFFGRDGRPGRTLALADALDPQDFIVNNAGEVFVFDKGRAQVLRYGPDGKETATLPLGTGVNIAADGIMLTAEQDLMLVQENQSYWTLVHQGITVAPQLQTLTRQEGVVSPRSPAIFHTLLSENNTPELQIIGLTGGIGGDMMMEVSRVSTSLPAEARFFNVDRAMNLYFTRNSPDNNAIDVWRVSPDGTTAGGARIALGDCRFSWRAFYIDQPGTAWTLCLNEQGATVKRYTLVDSNGHALSEVGTEAAAVPWRPGARFSAA